MSHKTFANALRSEIHKAGFTYREVSERLGLFRTAVSNILQRNSVTIANYNNLLDMFPNLKDAPMPKNLKHKKDKVIATRKSRPTFSVALQKCIDSHRINLNDLSSQIGLSYKGLQRVLYSNRTSTDTYYKLLDVFPELKRASKPDGLRRIGSRRYASSNRITPVKKLEHKPAHEPVSKIVKSDIDEFRVAASLIKIRKSEVSSDIKYILQVMKEKNISIDKLIDMLK